MIHVAYSNIGCKTRDTYSILGLDYPSSGGGNESREQGSYGSIVRGASESYSVPYVTSMGEAVWTLTSDGQVALTGPRDTPWIVQYLRPVPYDPKGRPEETWGVVNPLRGLWKGGGVAFSATLPYLATYWPGISKTDEGSIYGASDPWTTNPVQIANYRLHAYIQNTDLPEEVLIAQWTNTKQGILTQARVHDWSNPDFDDFVMVEYIFTNLGDFDGDGQEDRPGQTKTQERVYFAFVNYEIPTYLGFGWFRPLSARVFDDIYAYSDAAGYRGAFPMGLKASLWRDSDNPATSWDDAGEPFYFRESISTGRFGQTEGQMQAAATWAMAPLAFRNTGPSHAFNPKDRAMKYVDPVGEQPYAARWWKARSTTDYDDPDPNRDPEKKLYDEMTAQKIQDNPNEASPGDRTGYVHAQVYGPYTLRPGQSAKIVIAFVAGHPAQMKADPRQGMGAMDILTWDRSNDPVEKKQAEMKTLGEQALLENLRLAQFAYDSEYHIPAAPTNAFIAADDLTSSPDAHQQVSWADDSDRAINPYYKEADVIGYRVYRSTWFGVGPWELWDTIEKGKGGKTVNGRWTYTNGRYTYEDLLSAAGFEYHYSVRPFARGHADWAATLSDGSVKTLADIPVARARANVTRGYESGWGPSTARTFDGNERRPFQPATPEADRLERRVRVVPNPYYVDGLHNYPNTVNIRFVNLPRKSKIYIYSVSGDHIKTIQHDETVTVETGGVLVPKTAGQKGENVFRQYTWNLSGQVSTGLYFFAVVSEVPESMGKVQRGSFVVIK
jgi:hypothetical protein